ncbi:MAG TPA: cytochrome c [Bryobacteraceae bacterium]|nr:cytochrome c [Bryobacteraceae bacterium]
MRYLSSALCGVSLTAALFAGIASAQTGSGEKATISATQAAITASKEDAAQVARGAKLFAANCAGCHGATAKGMTGKDNTDLVRSLYVLDDEKGILLTPPIRNGRPDKGMPASTLTDDEIKDVAAWLRVQSYGAGHRTTYTFLDILTGDPQKGEAYFNGAGKCNTCHSPSGDLKGIGGRYSAQQLQGRWLSPGPGRAGRGGRGASTASTAVSRATRTVTVTLPNGETASGPLDHIDDFNVALHDSTGAYRSFARNGDTPKVVINDPLKVHVEMLKTYTDADIHNVTAYLVTLK